MWPESLNPKSKIQNPKSVQRSLVVTCGPLANQVGERLTARLQERVGPAEVVAVVAADHAQALESALVQISQMAGKANLSQKGWQLERFNEIAVYLILDLDERDDLDVPELMATIAAAAHRQLGATTTALLLSLVTDSVRQQDDKVTRWPGDKVAEDSSATPSPLHPVTLAPPHLFPRGAFILSLLNEEGLRLADASTMVETAAEALWAFIATPLHDTLEWLATQSPNAGLSTLGLHVWGWSPTPWQEALTRRWLLDVLTCWLSAVEEDRVRGWQGDKVTENHPLTPSPCHPLTPSPPHPIATHWLEQTHLSPGDLATLALAGEKPPPDFPPAAWQRPWPWRLHALLTGVIALDEADQAAQPEREARLQARLVEPVQKATSDLLAEIHHFLADQPGEGVVRLPSLLQSLLAELGSLSDTAAMQQEIRAEQDEALAEERATWLQQLESLLVGWPRDFLAFVKPPGFGQLPFLLRFWRWPALLWRYGRLQAAGRQLAIILARQAARRQQTAVTQALLTAYQQLQEAVKPWYDRATAAANSLAQWAAALAESNPDAPPSLYQQLVGPPRQEAMLANQALAAEERPLVGLDSGLRQALLQIAQERLAGLNRLTAADVLLALYPSPAELVQWWEAQWSAATPLWHTDEAQLSEVTRAQPTTLTIVCGANLTPLAERLSESEVEGHCAFGSATHLTAATDIRWLESDDRQRIIILRLRAGLGVMG